jgi:hypothetical protein
VTTASRCVPVADNHVAAARSSRWQHTRVIVSQVGVHVADVSHWIPTGSPLDLEATVRGCAVYSPAGSLPMLPHALGEGLCSLDEGVDRFVWRREDARLRCVLASGSACSRRLRRCGRLALSVVCEMTGDGAVVGEPWVGRTVICNRRTLDYATATLLMRGDSDAVAACDPDVLVTLRTLASIAGRRRRCALLLLPLLFFLLLLLLLLLMMMLLSRRVRHTGRAVRCRAVSCRARAAAGDLMLDPHVELNFATSGDGDCFFNDLHRGGSSTDSATGLRVEGYSIRQDTEADYLVEEFMLIANYLTARKLSLSWERFQRRSVHTAVVVSAAAVSSGVGPCDDSRSGAGSATHDGADGARAAGGAGSPAPMDVSVVDSYSTVEPAFRDVPPHFLFRRHPAPRREQLRNIQQFCDRRGLIFNAKDGKAMQWSLMRMSAEGMAGTVIALQRHIVRSLPRSGTSSRTLVLSDVLYSRVPCCALRDCCKVLKIVVWRVVMRRVLHHVAVPAQSVELF